MGARVKREPATAYSERLGGLYMGVDVRHALQQTPHKCPHFGGASRERYSASGNLNRLPDMSGLGGSMAELRRLKAAMQEWAVRADPACGRCARALDEMRAELRLARESVHAHAEANVTLQEALNEKNKQNKTLQVSADEAARNQATRIVSLERKLKNHKKKVHAQVRKRTKAVKELRTYYRNVCSRLRIRHGFNVQTIITAAEYVGKLHAGNVLILQQQLKEEQQKNEQALQDMTKLYDDVKRLQEESRILADDITKKESQIKQLTLTLNGIEELRNKVVQLQTENSSLSETLVAINQENHDLTNQKENLRAQLMIQFDNIRDNIDALDELTQLNKLHDTRRNQLEAIITRQKNEIDQYQTRFETQMSTERNLNQATILETNEKLKKYLKYNEMLRLQNEQLITLWHEQINLFNQMPYDELKTENELLLKRARSSEARTQYLEARIRDQESLLQETTSSENDDLLALNEKAEKTSLLIEGLSREKLNLQSLLDEATMNKHNLLVEKGKIEEWKHKHKLEIGKKK